MNDPLSASGKFAAREFSVDSSFALGWFNSKKQGWPIENFVGVLFQSLTKAGRIVMPLYGTARGGQDTGSPTLPFTPDDTSYEWTLRYDPAAANGRGAITFRLNGQSTTAALSPGDKLVGASFDRFGVLNMQRANSKWCDVYLDDLRYTAGKNEFPKGK